MVAPAYLPGDPDILEPPDDDGQLGVPADLDGDGGMGGFDDGGDDFDVGAFERSAVQEERAMMRGLAGRGASRKSYPYMYWRKPDDPETGRKGDITFGPSWAPDFMDWQEQGFTPLFTYGRFGQSNPREPGGPWEPSKEPFRRILMHSKGPREFSVELILELGWHRRAPYPGIKFPQLAKIDLAAHNHKCRICNKMCPSEVDLLRHQQIAHKDRSASEKLSRDLADAIGTGQKPTSAAVDKLAVFAEQQAQMMQSRDTDVTELRVMMAQMMQQNQLLMAQLLGQQQVPAGTMPPVDPISDGTPPTLPQQPAARKRPPRKQKPRGRNVAAALVSVS